MTVLIVGAGPSGLSAARVLAQHGVDVTVVDRDPLAGGIPAYADHQGYGLRDLHRSLRGPAYARVLADQAAAAGARIQLQTMATSVASDPLRVDLTSPHGREKVTPEAIILATGCRERPRAARLIPGSRPEGVWTTGWLQRHVAGGGRLDGRRAVIIGAEHVSFSAVATLAHAGARAVAMVTDAPTHTSYAAFRAGAQLRWRVPLITRSTVIAIHGSGRVTGVDVDIVPDLTVEHRAHRRRIDCDLVIVAGDWIPDGELATRLGVLESRATRGPIVDQLMRTSAPGVLAVGNLLHPPATADVCALSARRVVDGMLPWLESGAWQPETVPIEVEEPLMWCSPGVVAAGQQIDELILMSARSVSGAAGVRIRISQSDRTLWAGRVPWLRPTRPARVRGDWSAQVGAGPVRISIDR